MALTQCSLLSLLSLLAVQVSVHTENLYVEKIDLGEAEPRTVVSGLVKHVPIDEMKGARVVCVCNLKPRELQGVQSQAMVLCGKAADGGGMELVTPPAGVANGERVVCAGASRMEPTLQVPSLELRASRTTRRVSNAL